MPEGAVLLFAGCFSFPWVRGEEGAVGLLSPAPFRGEPSGAGCFFAEPDLLDVLSLPDPPCVPSLFVVFSTLVLVVAPVVVSLDPPHPATSRRRAAIRPRPAIRVRR
jgi:hypothetical protein